MNLSDLGSKDNPLTALVTDDDRDLAKSLKEFCLKAWGLDVDDAATMIAAFRARRQQEAVDTAVARLRQEGLMKNIEMNHLQAERDALEKQVRELNEKRTGVPPEAICCFRDGNMWAAVYGDFKNPQESPVGFGLTPNEAAERLEAEISDKR